MIGLISTLLFTLACIAYGVRIIKILIPASQLFVRMIGAYVYGTIITVTAIYLLTIITRPIGGSVSIISWFVTLIGLGLFIPDVQKYIRTRKTLKGVFHIDNLSILAATLFSVVLAFYIMVKSFHLGNDGTMLIGSNEVFDFGHLLSIVRSFSWGENIPYTSPFVAGMTDIYHFMFYFWIAILERFGLPIDLAVNIPSTIGFASMLLSIYLMAVRFSKSKTAGWFAIILTVTHSTIGFFYYIAKRGIAVERLRDIWNLSKYPFEGITDGSVISIFMTLNTFVNQRHLGFAIAVMFVGLLTAYEILERKNSDTQSMKKWIFFGVITGVLMLWHISIYGTLLISIVILLIVHKRWQDLVLYTGCAIGIGFITAWPWVRTIALYNHTTVTNALMIRSENMIYNGLVFWVFNLGLLPLISLVGLLRLDKKSRVEFMPLTMVVVLTILLGFMVSAGYYQKLLNIAVIGLNVSASIGLVTLWKLGNAWKGVVMFCLFVCTISGIMDLMVIKNDFQYPAGNSKIDKVITWIRTSTPPSSVILSYPDIFDPVTLAGRKNYWGFFHNVGQSDRSTKVKYFYEKMALEKSGLFRYTDISYVIVPKWEKTDFTYEIDLNSVRKNYTVVYEDDYNIVFLVRENG